MTDDRDPLLPARRALTAIVELSAMLHGQAKARAAHHDMPGGDAMVMLAPVASPEAWQNRADTIERLWWEDDETTEANRPDPLRDEEDREPPLRTLLFWSEAWRFEHGRVSDLRPTVVSETKFLASILEWAYDNETHWDDFVRDLRRAVSQMEALLRAGERDEPSGVPCLDCRRDQSGQPIVRFLTRRVDQHGGRRDEWNCPRCRRTYDYAAFLRARHQLLVEAQERVEQA